MTHKFLLFLSTVVLFALLSCNRGSQHQEPHYPQYVDWPQVHCERGFEMYGADTLWQYRVDYTYDSRGRLHAAVRSDAQGRLIGTDEYSYQANVETVQQFDGQHRLLAKFVYTYPDTLYRPAPEYENTPYYGWISVERFSPDGTLLARYVKTRDTRHRVIQTDGFDIADGVMIENYLYYPYGSDYTVVSNPQGDNEQTISGSCRYADSLCRYKLTDSKQLNSGVYETTYTYDSLGRRLTQVGMINQTPVDNIEWVYLPDRIYHVDHHNNTQVVYYLAE